MKAKSFDAFTQIIEYIIRYFKGVVLVAVILIVLSGVYRVESNEVAVVLRFGRLVGNTAETQIKNPGLHFSLPFFIDEVIKIPVETVHEKEITAHYMGEAGKSVAISKNVEESGYLLTGDNNVVLIRAMVKYKIANAAQYALYFNDPSEMINCIVSGEFTRSVTHMNIDLVLTSGKAQLSSQIMNSSQAILDELKTGIMITNLELTEVVPPFETSLYFKSVITASVNKETRIQKAKEEASTMRTQAQAEARSYKQNSISAQTIKLTKVRNEMAEFNGLHDQYVKNPRTIIDGTFRQRVNMILAKSGGSVIVAEGGGSSILILP